MGLAPTRCFAKHCPATASLGWVRAEQAEAVLAAKAEVLPSDANVFRREGEFWTLTFNGHTARLKDAKGLRDISELIARQGRELHVADLIAGSEGVAVAATMANVSERRSATTTSAEPILDERARAAYRRRLNELREELEEAEQFSDAARAERAREEMDMVAGELASALGLGGRPRTATTAAERARKAVAQRVRNALRRLEAEHPTLARHLDRSLRMGSFCSYSPEHPVDWAL
jgi:hypothetical protein